VLEIHLN